MIPHLSNTRCRALARRAGLAVYHVTGPDGGRKFTLSTTRGFFDLTVTRHGITVHQATPTGNRYWHARSYRSVSIALEHLTREAAYH